DRAEVLRDAGLTRDAEWILAGAARTFGTHGMRQARAEAEFHLSRSLHAHDLAAAARTARTAARRFRALGSATWAARADAVALRAELATASASGGRRRRPVADVDGTAAYLDAAGFRRDALALRQAAE